MTSYKPSGVCARNIDLELADDGTIERVAFDGGCHGNLKAIALLVSGKDAREVANMLRGNTCGHKSTSCADQLAQAIDQELGTSR